MSGVCVQYVFLCVRIKYEKEAYGSKLAKEGLYFTSSNYAALSYLSSADCIKCSNFN